jgi:pimeloyl-ACP methyl ester carboxylesterase
MPLFTTVDRAQLHYEISGHGDPTLVFVHGWCSNLEHWERQVPYFVERHRVLRIDRRGHGRSSVPERDVSPEQHGSDLAALLAALEIEGAVVVGHAGGGPSVLELAGRHPERIRAAVLVDAGLYSGVGPEKAMSAPAVTRLQTADYLDTFVRQYEGYFHRLSGSDLARRIAADAARTPQRVVVDELTWIFKCNTIEMASRVKQPVLWVVSSEAKTTSARVREHLPQAQFAQVVGAGHFLHLEVPEQFNPMLRRFVDGLS